METHTFIRKCVCLLYTSKKRVFRMAPFHHHLELGGMSETQIGVLYMSITGVCCLAAIMLLQ